MNALDEALATSRRSMVIAALFSGADGVLLLTIPLYSMQVYDRVLASRSLDTLFYLTLIAVAALWALGLLDVAKVRVLSSVGLWLDRRLGPEAYQRALAASQQQLSYRTEALRDLTQIRNFVSGPHILAFFDLPWVPVFLAAIGFLHPLLGCIACVSALFLFALAFLNDRLTRDRTRAAGEVTMQAMQIADAGCRNAEVLDALGMTDTIVGRWVATNDAALHLSDAVARRTGWIVGISKAARLTIQVLMTGAGAWLVLRQEFTGGAMIAGSIMLARALAPVDRSISAWKAFVACRAAHERLRRHLQAPILRPASMALPSPCGRLELEGVGLALPGCDRPVLHDVGFALPAGEALAIIGSSAAGKSSLARLIVGTRPPTAGHVRLDGADIAWLDRARLGPFLGYLPQDVELFAGTVAENIARMGKIEPEAVVAAARLAGAHGMILRLPRGYETDIGEGGRHLSGGQRQRVALARALYGDPRLVVLDEPDASLDAEGQEALLQAFGELKARGSTVVAVTHKAGLLDRMDKLAVLVNGSLSQFGPRDEVLAGIARSRASAIRGEAAE